MTEYSDVDYWVVVSQQATGEQLRDVAARRLDLHHWILQNPNTYPELRAWIEEYSAAQGRGLASGGAASGAAGARDVASGGATSGDVADGGSVGGAPSIAVSQVASLEVPATGKGQPRRTMKPWAVVASVAVVTALVLSGVVFAAVRILGSKDVASAGAGHFKVMPTSARTVELSASAEPIRLVPVGGPGQVALRHGNLTVVGMVVDAGYLVTAIDMDSEGAHPVWSLPLPEPTGGDFLDCAFVGEVFSCGDSPQYDIAGGAPLPVDLIAETGGEATGSSAVSADDSEDEAEGTAASVADTDTAESGVDADVALVANETQVLAVGPQEGGQEAPYVMNGQLFSGSGKPVADVGVAPELYGVRVGDQGDRWVVFDSGSLIGLKGSSEQWRLALPEGTDQLNGLDGTGEPRLRLDGNTLLIGTPEGVWALDASTGEERWSVDVELDSWEVDATTLVVSGGGVLSVLPFPEQGEDALESDGEEMVLSGPLGGTPMPTETEIANSTMTVHQDCVDFVTMQQGSGTAVKFVDGEAQLDSQSGGSLSLTVWGYTVLSGTPVAIVDLYCYGGGTTGFNVVTAVDADLKRVADVPIGAGISAFVRRPPNVEGIAVEGTTLIMDVSGYETVGSPISYVTYQSTLMWDGKEYVLTDGVWELPNGQNVRAPKVAELQEIYDAVAEGNEASVSQYFEPRALNGLDSPGFGGNNNLTPRGVLWLPGGKVLGCGLVAPVGESLWDLAGTGMATVETHSYGSEKAGDFICAVDSTFIEEKRDVIDMWWIVTTGEAGNVLQIQQGRNFA